MTSFIIAAAQYPIEQLADWQAYEAKVTQWVRQAAEGGAQAGGAGEGPGAEAGREEADGKGKKERVLHTRVPAVLERELKRFADNLRIPVIMAIHGGCIGGAVDMVTAGCIRYATQDAFFCIQQTLLCFTYLKTGKVSLYITIHGNIVIIFGSYEVLTFQIQ